jgi:hypothetical protein
VWGKHRHRGNSTRDEGKYNAGLETQEFIFSEGRLIMGGGISKSGEVTWHQPSHAKIETSAS